MTKREIKQAAGIKANKALTVTILKPSRKGANKRGICAHKATKLAKSANRQYVPGFQPQPVTAYRPSAWR